MQENEETTESVYGESVDEQVSRQKLDWECSQIDVKNSMDLSNTFIMTRHENWISDVLKIMVSVEGMIEALE